MSLMPQMSPLEPFLELVSAYADWGVICCQYGLGFILGCIVSCRAEILNVFGSNWALMPDFVSGIQVCAVQILRTNPLVDKLYCPRVTPSAI